MDAKKRTVRAICETAGVSGNERLWNKSGKAGIYRFFQTLAELGYHDTYNGQFDPLPA